MVAVIGGRDKEAVIADCDNSGCRLSPSQFRFAFIFFSEGENRQSTFMYCNKNMFLLILSLLFNESGATGLDRRSGATGLQRAGALIKEPLNSHKQINDIILTGITDSLEENSYRLQVLRMRVGSAWELVFTDYGFTKQPSGIDLINHRRKIATELKNGYRINSIVRREDFRRLKEFKRQHQGTYLDLVSLMIR